MGQNIWSTIRDPNWQKTITKFEVTIETCNDQNELISMFLHFLVFLLFLKAYDMVRYYDILLQKVNYM